MIKRKFPYNPRKKTELKEQKLKSILRWESYWTERCKYELGLTLGLECFLGLDLALSRLMSLASMLSRPRYSAQKKCQISMYKTASLLVDIYCIMSRNVTFNTATGDWRPKTLAIITYGARTCRWFLLLFFSSTYGFLFLVLTLVCAVLLTNEDLH